MDPLQNKEIPTEGEQKMTFTAFHGLYSAAEFIPVKKDIFRLLLPTEEIPATELSPGFYFASMSFMRNWLYLGFSVSYASDQENSNELLVSRLSQYSLCPKLGYNILRRPQMAVSAYGGIRYTRFRQLTGLKQRRVALEEYLLSPDIDLRVSQFSAEIGFNASVPLGNIMSIGFFAAYLHPLQKNPFVRTRENRITNATIVNPLGNMAFGLGLGFGFNDFR